MKLHELQPAAGSKTAPKRLGRGIGSGIGKTSGKGHKGQKARSGGGVRPGFEGGQMPLTRRIPKRGFTNIFAKEYTIINVRDLEGFEAGSTINAQVLKEAGVIRKIEKDGVKVLGNGTLSKKLNIQVAKCSASAKEKIEAVGGSVEVVE